MEAGSNLLPVSKCPEVVAFEAGNLRQPASAVFFKEGRKFY